MSQTHYLWAGSYPREARVILADTSARLIPETDYLQVFYCVILISVLYCFWSGAFLWKQRTMTSLNPAENKNTSRTLEEWKLCCHFLNEGDGLLSWMNRNLSHRPSWNMPGALFHFLFSCHVIKILRCKPVYLLEAKSPENSFQEGAAPHSVSQPVTTASAWTKESKDLKVH